MASYTASASNLNVNICTRKQKTDLTDVDHCFNFDEGIIFQKAFWNNNLADLKKWFTKDFNFRDRNYEEQKNSSEEWEDDGFYGKFLFKYYLFYKSWVMATL